MKALTELFSDLATKAQLKSGQVDKVHKKILSAAIYRVAHHNENPLQSAKTVAKLVGPLLVRFGLGVLLNPQSQMR